MTKRLSIVCLFLGLAGQSTAGDCPAVSSVNVASLRSGTSSWTEAFRQAIRALPCGGTVLVPAGHYALHTVEVTDGITIEGVGEATVLERKGPGVLFDVTERHGVTFKRLAIDVRAVSNFRTAIRLTRGGSHRVEQIRFFTSSAPQFGWTIHAIGARGVDGLHIIDNRNEGMQFKLGAPETGAGPRTYVRGNTFIDPHNFAVSYVGRKSTDTVDLLTLEGNQVIGAASNGGFFVGVDGDRNDSAVVQRILIHGNHIDFRDPASQGIFVRGGSQSADLIITNNTVRRNARSGNTNAIIVKGNENAGPWRRIVISNNTLSNADHSVNLRSARFISASVIGNVIENSVMEVVAGDGDTEAVLIAANLFNGENGPAKLVLQTGKARPGQNIVKSAVSGNHFVDCGGAAVTLVSGSGSVLDVDVSANTFRECVPVRQKGAGTQRGLRQ